MKQNLYTIQEVSSILGVSTKTLRRWEENGIIKPIRTAGNQRRYRLEDVSKLERRRRLKEVKNDVKEEIKNQVLVPLPVKESVVSQPQHDMRHNQVPAPVIKPIVSSPFFPKYSNKGLIKPLFSGMIVIAILLGGASLWQQLGYPGLHFGMRSSQKENKKESVLGDSTSVGDYQLEVNISSLFTKPVKFLDTVAIQKGLSVRVNRLLMEG